ncbi:MAG: hypothetical protein ThorAB25_22410 [Candidatus Thorarchaeota archaeon AB_25]|nr:MAG: hypothetical protein ThorAB25_22410 [Candidatus Thorarchaeota archaeon AB_25]
MLLEPDIQKLAVESRQRLVQEFAEKYANLRERVRRVPDADARKISEDLSCPLEIAMIAYLINMDGIMGVKHAVGLLSAELQRRATVGEDVPNLPGNIMEFALIEGRWISHIYGSFVRQLELKVRELANLEEGIEGPSIEVERALSIIAARTKMSETIIAPVIEEWSKEHPKATGKDSLNSYGQAITKWNISTLNGKFIQVQRRNQALFRVLRESLLTASDSFTMDAAINRIDTLIEELGRPFDEMTLRAISHILVHLAPRQTTGRGDRSAYVSVGVSSTRGNKAEPDLISPFDFLERDVKLAKRRKGQERDEYLKEKIARVMRVLKYQENTHAESVEKCMIELVDRLEIKDFQMEKLVEDSKAAIASASEAERDSLSVTIVFDFVTTNIYGEEAA